MSTRQYSHTGGRITLKPCAVPLTPCIETRAQNLEPINNHAITAVPVVVSFFFGPLCPSPLKPKEGKTSFGEDVYERSRAGVTP